MNPTFRLLQRVVSSGYRAILKEEIGPEAKNFINNLLIVTLGSGLASLGTFAFTILGGRLLGPEEFGKFSLIQSVAFILYIPMLAGFGVGLVKYASETSNLLQQKKILGTTFRLTALTTVVSVIVILLLRPWIIEIFSITPEMLIIALFVSVVYVLSSMANSVQRGLKLMKSYAVWQPVYAFILLVLFGVFAFLRVDSFRAMALPLLVAYGITGLGIMIMLGVRNHLSFGYDYNTAKKLMKYSFFGLIVLISSSIYTNVGRIFVAHYLTFSDVGVYSAYFGSSINLGSILFLTFNAVFFPTISGYEDQRPVLAKFERILPYFVIGGITGVFIFESIALRLFGEGYPRDIWLMVLFAATTVLNIWYLVYSNVFNAKGLRGAKYSAVTVVIMALVIFSLSFGLIPIFGVAGAVGASAISFGVGIIFLRGFRQQVFGRLNDQPPTNLN